MLDQASSRIVNYPEILHRNIGVFLHGDAKQNKHQAAQQKEIQAIAPRLCHLDLLSAPETVHKHGIMLLAPGERQIRVRF